MGKMHLAPAGPAFVALHLTDRHRFRNHVTFKVGLEGFTWQIDEGHLEHPSGELTISFHHLGDILTCNHGAFSASDRLGAPRPGFEPASWSALCLGASEPKLS